MNTWLFIVLVQAGLLILGAVSWWRQQRQYALIAKNYALMVRSLLDKLKARS